MLLQQWEREGILTANKPKAGRGGVCLALGVLLPRSPRSLCRLPGLLEDLREPHSGLCSAISGAVPQISSLVSE